MGKTQKKAHKTLTVRNSTFGRFWQENLNFDLIAHQIYNVC
jgi:hypothetical protein|nr:MAG TPA: Protein of unknown function (DUF321) [Caudoviricetes sp.]